MKFAYLAIFFIALFAITAFAEPLAEVKVLNDSNFYNFIDANPEKRIFVKFFAPWCGHCKAMAADYIALASANTDENIVYAEVDCTTSRALCKAFDIKGFPSMKIIADGKYGSHSGGRDQDSIYKSVREAKTTETIMMTRPPAIQFNQIIAEILHDLKEMITMRFNATALIFIVSFLVGYIIRPLTSAAPAKKTKRE